MNIEATAEATTTAATQAAHVVTISSEHMCGLAAAEAFRRFIDRVEGKGRATAKFNPDGSITVSINVVAPDEH